MTEPLQAGEGRERRPGPDRTDRLSGLLLGTLLGDALGLPREGLSPRRAERLFGPGDLVPCLVPGWSTISDDTEHAALTGVALLWAGSDPEAFAAALGRELRLWFLALPPGIGFATVRAIGKLWLGFPPGSAGVRSQGNGPLMRSPLLGAVLSGDPDLRDRMVLASTRVTHRGPEVEEAALVAARAAGDAASGWSGGFDPGRWSGAGGADRLGPILRERLDLVGASLTRGEEPAEFVARLGLSGGVTGWALDTLPAALYCWLRYPGDFRRSVGACIRLGGDADSTGALVGALAGASVGVSGLPEDWLSGVWSWPWTRERLVALAGDLTRSRGTAGRGSGLGPVRRVGMLARNLGVLAVVLGHGLRRLLPPW